MEHTGGGKPAMRGQERQHAAAAHGRAAAWCQRSWQSWQRGRSWQSQSQQASTRGGRSSVASHHACACALPGRGSHGNGHGRKRRTCPHPRSAGGPLPTAATQRSHALQVCVLRSSSNHPGRPPPAARSVVTALPDRGTPARFWLRRSRLLPAAPEIQGARVQILASQ